MLLLDPLQLLRDQGSDQRGREQGTGTQVEQGEDGSTLRQFEVRQPNPFLRWILSMEGEAVIEAPPSLKEAFRALAQQVADLYREDANA